MRLQCRVTPWRRRQAALAAHDRQSKAACCVVTGTAVTSVALAIGALIGTQIHLHARPAAAFVRSWSALVPSASSYTLEGGPARLPRTRPSQPNARTRRSAADPNFAANVGQAIDTLRAEHAQLPDGPAPGLRVAAPGVTLEIAQLPSLRFEGERQYGEFWDNFRSGVSLVASSARSEVVQVVHSGLYVRIRWRLLLTPRTPTTGEAAATAANALRAAKGVLGAAAAASGPDKGARSPQSGGLLGGLFGEAENFLGEAERWASSASSGDGARNPIGGQAEERTVELNSIYELDCWNGRVLKHTLEFRSPTEDFDLLGAVQGVPSFR